MEAGINQLLRYCNNRKPEENEGAEKLFYYNQILVSTYIINKQDLELFLQDMNII